MREPPMTDFEEFTAKLPRNLLEVFRTIAAQNGEDPNSVIAQLIHGYVQRHKDISRVKTSGVIEVYVKSALKQWIDLPPARELEADEFIERTLEKIHKKLVVTDDQARMVAFRIWQELKKPSNKAENSSEDDTVPDDQEPA